MELKKIWCDEFWSITLKKLKSVSCSVCGCTVLLKDKEIPGHFTDRRQQFLGQQHFSVVLSVHLDARIHKDEISNTQLLTLLSIQDNFAFFSNLPR